MRAPGIGDRPLDEGGEPGDGRAVLGESRQTVPRQGGQGTPFVRVAAEPHGAGDLFVLVGGPTRRDSEHAENAEAVPADPAFPRQCPRGQAVPRRTLPRFGPGPTRTLSAPPRTPAHR